MFETPRIEFYSHFFCLLSGTSVLAGKALSTRDEISFMMILFSVRMSWIVSWACPRALSVNVLTPRLLLRVPANGHGLLHKWGFPNRGNGDPATCVCVSSSFTSDRGFFLMMMVGLSCSNYVYLRVWQAPFLLEKNDSMRYIRGVRVW
jgi:hypothetical protein